MEENKAPICLFPFYAFYYRGDDFRIGSCCMQKPMLSTVKDGDIKSWWTSEDAQKIRQQFLDGEWPDSCKICKEQHQAGQETIADRWAREFMLEIGASYNDLDVVKGNSKGEPIFIDYRPDNLCNLSCSMCNPGASSQIEKMARALDVEIWPGLPQENSFQHNDQIKSVITKNTKRIKLNGGEPTINAKIKDIYEYAIQNKFAKDIYLQFTTNFTNFNKTFELLDEFKVASVSASLDGTGATYEYIRTPAKWDVVRGNILKFKDLKNKHKHNPGKYRFAINTVWYSATCFTILDWVPELLDFLNEHFPHSKITLNQCQTPAFQNLTIIPNEYRDDIKNNIETLRTRYPKWNYLFDEMLFGLDWFQFNPQNLKKWQEVNPKMDAYKKIDITKLHSVYKELLEYNV